MIKAPVVNAAIDYRNGIYIRFRAQQRLGRLRKILGEIHLLSWICIYVAESLLFRSRQSLFLITAIIQPVMPQGFFCTRRCETMGMQNNANNEIIKYKTYSANFQE